MKFIPALLLTVILLTACATNQPLALKQIAAKGVNSSTYARIESGRVLGYTDILNLVKADVPDAAIVSYLKSTKAPYRLTTAQFEQLTDAGAASDLVNYLGKSVGYYEATKRSQTGGSQWNNHPYFNDPAYVGDAPFPYAFPDEWNDPAAVRLWF